MIDYYKLWINDKFLPENIKNIILKYSSEEIKEYFKNDLEFGTAGIRAKMGYGSAFFNIINVRRAAIAFAEFLKIRYSKKILENKGIIIGHDNRKLSKEFSIETAKIFISYGIKVTLFNNNKPYPTPLVSFAIKDLKLIGGIVITASHNSKEYNGFKIFDQNGCQFLPVDTIIISEKYKNIFHQSTIFFSDDNWKNTKLLFFLNKNFINKYISAALKNQIYKEKTKNIKIIFSNLHGTSKEIMPKIFEKAGYKYYVVKEHYQLDENFTNCPNPNPELDENYIIPHKYAKKHNADIVILNDPDADRIGVSVFDNNDYKILSANDLAPIILNYLINVKFKNKLKKNKYIIYSTFVSSDLCDLIAKINNIQVKKTLTGFKWIGNEIIKNINNKKKIFLLAYEEANGFIINNNVNDKDGIQVSLLIAEIVQYYKTKNKTVIQVLDEIYKKYGYYYCYTVNKNLNSNININQIMNKLRNSKINNILHLRIIEKEDYLNGLYNMPSDNLLKFYFNNDSWIAIRPSGTEPKIKFYFVFKSEISKKNSILQLNAIKEEFFNIFFKDIF